MIQQKYKKLWNHYEQLHINKLDNLEKNGEFLETYKLPRLNHEETENLNRITTSKETERVIKKHPANSSLGSDGFHQ